MEKEDKMNNIKITYIADDARVYKVRQVHGRLMFNKGIQTFVDGASNDSTVEKSVFGPSVLSDGSYLENENGGRN